jgi:hypothetical protein
MKDRVTLKMVKAAYKATKTKPINQCFFYIAGGKVKKCCPMGVLYLDAKDGAVGFGEDVQKYAAKRFGARYSEGFYHAVDGFPLPKTKFTENYALGYKDGRRMAKALGLHK